MRPSCSIHHGRAAPSAGAPQSAELVERVTTREVMALARISRATLWRRVASGRLPQPVDQARQALFLKAHVIQALSIPTAQPASVSVAIEQRLEVLRARRQNQA